MKTQGEIDIEMCGHELGVYIEVSKPPLAEASCYAALVDDCQIIMDKIDSLRGCVDTSTERGLNIEESMCRARNYMMEARNDCAA